MVGKYIDCKKRKKIKKRTLTSTVSDAKGKRSIFRLERKQQKFPQVDLFSYLPNTGLGTKLVK